MRRLRLVWKNENWEVEGDEIVEGAVLPSHEPVSEESPAPFYWDLVDPAGKLAYSHAEGDPRIGFYDHLTEEGELEGGQHTQEYAVLDILVPDTPGAEFRLYAAPAAPRGKKTKKSPAVALTHRIGGRRG
ncbi:MAG: hypothetical protein M3323_07140 [Actinomycetota bacterium]|nr:hypothetical protein [Actinomycetota bacterium]